MLKEAADRAESAATWAARLADGRLPADRQAAFQDWMDADPDNARALEEVVGAWRAVEHYATSGPIMQMRQAALASAYQAAPARRTAHRYTPWAIAAAVLLTVGVAGVSQWMAPQVYTTGVGERRVVALADGSKLSLDGATQVKVSYSGGRRRLWLERGRAKFDVAKDALHPFSVVAADKIVVATGTAFSVERVQGKVRVILYEGHVAVLQQEGAAEPQVVSVANGATVEPADRALKPGTEMILPANAVPPGAANTVRVAAIDPVPSLQWEAGQLVFRDEPLGIVVERMNRYADHPLALGDQATANVRISGVFHASDTEALVQGLTVFHVVARDAGSGQTLRVQTQ